MNFLKGTQLVKGSTGAIALVVLGSSVLFFIPTVLPGQWDRSFEISAAPKSSINLVILGFDDS